jgi:dipeptidyl aminopeptidase/acylaminoacyl peptidase
LEDERSWFAGARLMHELLRNTNFKESPRRHAEEVRIPVLLIQGDEDSTVNPEQATLMDAALAHAGKPHRLVIVQGADHHFSEDAYFEKMLSEIGAFLHENLDAGTAAMTSTTTSAAAANSSAAH